MPLSFCGTYRLRDSVRFSLDLTIAMCNPVLISENSRSLLPTQVSPEALRSHRRGSPRSVGTSHVSQELPALTVYAIRLPSGENAGLILDRVSLVSAIGSPSGSSLMYS